ncbi:SUMF1/EgtB/PvdO family nonheme iron enzyme [Roseivirga sp. E12]|uniref:SUMF1/EgtB/PvdO family nonheme iron enzyme n=1 Tax=Roseivirga sp. E12 TaxID=2819237 RepID=UPI001ABD1602|nr:SUMF1/EgtB/PvdO family nonheme iron enzyme [Roseivirga sp. E12]
MRKSVLGLMIVLLLGATAGCSMFDGFLAGGGKEGKLLEEGQLLGVLDREGWYQELPYGMVAIPAGTFFMGQADEDVAASQINSNRQITVSPFFMDAEEITNNEYRQFLYHVSELAQNGDRYWDATLIASVMPNPKVWEEEFTYHYADRMTQYYWKHTAFDNYPVVGVSWEAAEKFAEWRTINLNNGQQIKYEGGGGLFSFGGKKKEREAAAAAADAGPVLGAVGPAGTANGAAASTFVDTSPIETRYPDFRLPTEAEWEYASRGGREIVKYPWGNPYTRNKDGCFLANFKPGRGAYADDGYPYTAPVNAFLPNPFNLYNMSGNVAEWCRDDFSPVYNPLVWDLNPMFTYNPETDSDSPHFGKKVVRGGAWNDVSYYLQTGTRSFEYRDVASASIGFRCAMDYLGQQ